MKITCERISRDQYRYSGYQKNKHCNLFLFLEDEINCTENYNEWVNDLLSKNNSRLVSDLLEYEFTKDELHIYLGLLGNNNPNEKPYIINKQILIKLMKTWIELTSKRVNKIIIDEIDSKIVIYEENFIIQINALLNQDKVAYTADTLTNKIAPLFHFLNNEIADSFMIEKWVRFIQYGDMGSTKEGCLMEINLRGDIAIIDHINLKYETRTNIDYFDIKRKSLIELINQWHELRSKKTDVIVLEEFQTNVKMYPLSYKDLSSSHSS